MAGYLDSYGVSDTKKEQLTKRVVLIGAGVVLVSLVLFLALRNFPEKRAVNQFLTELKAGNFQQAYRIWGCTPQSPCRDYKFEKFMEDWGPKGPYANVAAAKIPIVDSCGDGVVMTVEIPKVDPFGIWVDRKTKTLGFAPWPRCPGPHWHFWEFLQRQFS